MASDKHCNLFQEIEPFLEILLSERGSGRLTLEDYSSELRQFQNFLKKNLWQAEREDILSYLGFYRPLDLKHLLLPVICQHCDSFKNSG